MEIVLTTAENTDFENVRMALRSIEKHVRNFDEIVIIGHKPDWIQGVIHIPFSSPISDKENAKNTLKKLLSACISPKISENFIHWPINACVLKNMPINKYPYYTIGKCSDLKKKSKIKEDKLLLEHTSRFLANRGFSDNYFGGSFPIQYSKSKFLSTFDFKDENFETYYGYCIRTIYCHCNRIPGISFRETLLPEDSKGMMTMIDSMHTVNLDINQKNEYFKNFITSNFIKKSSYEKW